MKLKQKVSADHVKMLLKRSRMPRNQVAAISGLSNAYIRVLEHGESASVAREKLINFAVALNLDLHETDDLLTVFDRTKLTVDDIPNFINTSKQMRISSALLPLRDVFIIELMFLSIEWVPGHNLVVNDRPTAALRPEGYRTHSCADMENTHPIHN
ncbi:MAG: helix-turn-helix transcriptional regulator, partial [Desulfobacterales bacterium]